MQFLVGIVLIKPMQNSIFIFTKNFLLFGSVGVASLLSPLHAVPRISEFVALNTHSHADENGDSSDWIEIENTDGTAVSMEGWYLTDNPENLTKWTIPAVTLPPNGYLVIFASNKDRVDPAGTLHTNFTLQPGVDEFIALVEPDGTTIASSYNPPPPVQRCGFRRRHGRSIDRLGPS